MKSIKYLPTVVFSSFWSYQYGGVIIESGNIETDAVVWVLAYILAAALRDTLFDK